MGINNNYYEDLNYILLGHPDDQRLYAEKIVSEIKQREPHNFEGIQDSFSFELRYVPPFEKSFHELKRLQGTAAVVAGRRDEFMGYIIIDLSGYLTHEKEDYFEIALLFLADMSDHWKYIFVIDDTNTKAAKDLTRSVLSVLARANLFCEIKESAPTESPVYIVNAICKEHGINCAAPVKMMLQRLIEEGYNKEIISAFLWDISRKFGEQINISTLNKYLLQEVPVFKYMLNEKEYTRFTNIIMPEREKWNGEKEAI